MDLSHLLSLFSNLESNSRLRLVEKPQYTETSTIEYVPVSAPITNTKSYGSLINGISDELLKAQVQIESNGNPNAVSTAGAVGLAQFMPGTWQGAKNRGWISKDAKRTDPAASLQAQEAYMSWLKERPLMKKTDSEEEKVRLTLAAYNAGYGNLGDAVTLQKSNGGDWLSYMSKETQKYVPLIMGMASDKLSQVETGY